MRVDIHPRAQQLAGIGHRGLHGDVAGLVADLRLDSGHAPFERPARIRIRRHAHGLAERHAAQRLLRHREVRVQHVEIRERRDRVARVQVLPEVHAAQADHAGERRANQLLRNDRLGLADIGARGVEFIAACVECRLRLGAVRHELLGACELPARIVGLRLQPGELRLLGRIVKLHECLPGTHARARDELDADDAPRDFRRDGHLTDRFERADRVERRRRRLRVHDDGFDRQRRRWRRRPVGSRYTFRAPQEQRAKQDDQRARGKKH